MKSPEVQRIIDEMAKAAFNWDGDPEHCRICGNHPRLFRDDLSRKEFEISGICQFCQDSTFDSGEDEG